MKEYYFGNLTEDRVQFTTGRDIDLEPRQAGPALNFFIYPYAEVGGKAYPQQDIVRSFAYRDIESSLSVIGNPVKSATLGPLGLSEELLKIGGRGSRITSPENGTLSSVGTAYCPRALGVRGDDQGAGMPATAGLVGQDHDDAALSPSQTLWRRTS